MSYDNVFSLIHAKKTQKHVELFSWFQRLYINIFSNLHVLFLLTSGKSVKNRRMESLSLAVVNSRSDT